MSTLIHTTTVLSWRKCNLRVRPRTFAKIFPCACWHSSLLARFSLISFKSSLGNIGKVRCRSNLSSWNTQPVAMEESLPLDWKKKKHSHHLRNTKLILVFGYCGTNTRDFASLEKRCKNKTWAFRRVFLSYLKIKLRTKCLHNRVQKQKKTIILFRISKFFVRHFETKISDSKTIFVEWRFDIIVISFPSSNDKHLPFQVRVVNVYHSNLKMIPRWYRNVVQQI